VIFWPLVAPHLADRCRDYHGEVTDTLPQCPDCSSPYTYEVGTKVRGIRLMDGVGDHDIDCKVDGVGPMQLKSSVVKKA
jgi:uncharacterized Zn ribbon protein